MKDLNLPIYNYSMSCEASLITSVDVMLDGDLIDHVVITVEGHPKSITFSEEWYQGQRPIVGGYLVVDPESGAYFMRKKTFKNRYRLDDYWQQCESCEVIKLAEEMKSDHEGTALCATCMDQLIQEAEKE